MALIQNQQQQDHDISEEEEEDYSLSSRTWTIAKYCLSAVLLANAVSTTYNQLVPARQDGLTSVWADFPHRRLESLVKPDKDYVPSHMLPIMEELVARKKLMEETPKEEIKYWFEYAGPLQKYFYRFSKSRGKADYFEGRDDSGVTSARFVEQLGGGTDFATFLAPQHNIPEMEKASHNRMLDNCLAMGSPARPAVEKGTFWYDWFGTPETESKVLDRCRILFVMNTVGAGRGSTILWETAPPPPYTSGPKTWQSEQETAAMHLERNLKEIDAMCATGKIAARLQVLVCEPIPGEWTDWMDSQLVNCGGKPAPPEGVKRNIPDGVEVSTSVEVEDRASPLQVVVVTSAETANTCHDLKSGFMEKRMQEIVLAPPLLETSDATTERKLDLSAAKYDASVKKTHADLISSDHHDMYVAFKWSSLVTARAVSAFLQASADLAAAVDSPNVQKNLKESSSIESVISTKSNGHPSPFVIPSFVRMSYVSEENNKVAKWRMHGDFFHPAAWEVCKDSFDMTWIPDSLSSSGGVNGYCYADGISKEDCGQWWVFMAEEQMSTTPEVFASELTPPLVQGGSNFVWMLTENHRRSIVEKRVCEHVTVESERKTTCLEDPQAVMPLGDLESFFINYMPNSALGKKHETGRRPGYTVEEKREADRQKVRDRKQLKGQEDIEKALFDYTIYPAALFHKDATLKAARDTDKVLSKTSAKEEASEGIATVKSSYYDVTIIKPREATLGWCQNLARRGLCALFADYLRESNDARCHEACGMKKYWTPLQES